MSAAALPPGQRELGHFPRFGLLPFATRFPKQPGQVQLRICGDLRAEIELDAAHLASLPRVEQCSDFHCVTGWSRRGLRWGGVRLRDAHERLILPLAGPVSDVCHVILHGQDGGRCSLPLADLLADDVLLADKLDGQPLGIDHGAPLRLLAPAHYGYKSIKHLCRLEFRRDLSGYRPSAYRFMEHPRARVALEERGQGLPGWLLRLLYRPMIRPTAARFAQASAGYQDEHRP